ncbi:MAG: hypothetical protein QHH06_14770 [Clostridiales bacterium]|nr:hypothetical protein [Eubacteriales bacterium]MDH7567702.1 hypothetical protein [Clostridiales bacterium]
MKKKAKYPTTKLNEKDREVLGKYTSFYTNFIESGTARAQIPKKGDLEEK